MALSDDCPQRQMATPPESVCLSRDVDDGLEPALNGLVGALRARFGDPLAGIIVYGSCLRSGDVFDGLVDLYAVVDDYRVNPGRLLAAANRLLCPNVFYLEVDRAGRRIRSKYGIISRGDLLKNTTRCFESYFWGRLAQPVAILYSRRAEDRVVLETALANARETLLARALPALPGNGKLNDLCTGALSLSYSTELRAEGPQRARELVLAGGGFHAGVAQQWGARFPHLLKIRCRDGELFYESGYRRRDRILADIAWKLRRLWGKFLSLCRLSKALFTFRGGLDYIAWKLERHSGQTVEIPARVRRRPLIYGWIFAWRLYRRGVIK